MIEKLHRFEKLKTSKSIWIGFFVLGLLCFLLSLQKEASTESSSQGNSSETADTYIPSGYVLVPIEIQNYQSLDSVLGSWGVVDLYKSSQEENKGSQKVAQRVKILRAPLDPTQFAVLVKEIQAPAIAKYDGPYFVVVQNPKAIGTVIEQAPKQFSRLVEEDGTHETN